MIVRMWTGRIRTCDEGDYRDYIEATGGAQYRATPGNLGWQMLFRELLDGTSEVSTLSWWTDFDAIGAFAGSDVTKAKYYPEDDRFLIDRPDEVQHFRVTAGTAIRTSDSVCK